MSEKVKELDPFKPEEPTIPGVTGNPARKKRPPQPPRIALPQTAPVNNARPLNAISPRLWLAVVATLIVLVSLGVYLRKRPGASYPAQPATVAAGSELAPKKAPPAVPVIPKAPGPVATTSELEKPWSSKRFIFRVPLNSEDVPAMVVKLPGGVYWGVSMREPYGTCELQYVNDPRVLAADYQFTATHPMLTDPCSRAVFDLTEYGSGPNGVIRGAIVKGGAIRPPIAIEIRVRGKEVIATRIEPLASYQH
jgi:hypothetical protein